MLLKCVDKAIHNHTLLINDITNNALSYDELLLSVEVLGLIPNISLSKIILEELFEKYSTLGDEKMFSSLMFAFRLLSERDKTFSLSEKTKKSILFFVSMCKESDVKREIF